MFGCYTGLRYSDYSNIKPANIIEIEGEFFNKMITQKTKQPVIIPVNPIILELFEKYKDCSNKLPKSMSDVKFNKYLKEVARLVGFSSKGRVAETPDKQLWHHLPLLLSTGLSYIDLMKITGHTTQRSFLKYIRILKLVPQNDFSKNWNKYLLSAVG